MTKYFFKLITLLISFNISLMAQKSILNDKEEMEKYICSFPIQDYEIYNVPGQGKFYIEPGINDLVKNVLRSGRIWEPHLIPLIQKYARPGSVVIDIGAHIGTLTIPLANAVGPKGYVYVFEPQKKIFRELVANCVLNNIVDRVGLYRYAIGDHHCVVSMNDVTQHNEAGTGIGIGGDLAEMRTLDSFEFKNVSLIKIDVESTEDAVIDGMVKTLEENKPVIIIEIQGGHPWEKASPEIRKKILFTQSKLNALGYTVEQILFHDYLAMPN